MSKIEWCDETINPQGWGCYGPGGTPEKPQPCSYCYAKRMSRGPYVPKCEMCRQFLPHWHPEVLEKPLRWKKPRKIFWQSMGDLFHPFTPAVQIAEIIGRIVMHTPQHTHIFLSKNSSRYAEFNPWPDNCWLGTTVTCQEDADARIPELLKAQAKVLFVSAEPLLGSLNLRRYFQQPWICEFCFKTYYGDHLPGGWDFAWQSAVCPDCYQKVEQDGGYSVVPGGKYASSPDPRPWQSPIHWLIIGAMTGPGAVKPPEGAVSSLIQQARASNVPLFLKDNLRRPFKIQEFPKCP